MLNDLYSERLLEAAGSIPPARRIANAPASAKRSSRVCGSEVVVDLVVKDGVVADFGMEARACALGQASASLLARSILGATPAELFELRDAVRSMLKEGGPPPSGERWRQFEALAPIRAYPQRHASTLLVFEAVADCLEQLGFAPPSR